uniref:Protein misato homolog 1 n=1 Tax=Oncorhynchus kisutch TaxID=8019 RepID=A0A8C7H9V0_ONCKI
MGVNLYDQKCGQRGSDQETSGSLSLTHFLFTEPSFLCRGGCHGDGEQLLGACRLESNVRYNHDGEAHNLEVFGQGEALLQGSVLEDLEDRLHFFIEGYLQGFQVLCDLADGFSGLGSKVTEMLQDSYGGRGILSWELAPVSHPDTVSDERELYHLLNYSLGMVHMANNSSFVCLLTLKGGLGGRPMSDNPRNVYFCLLHPSLWYHSSSVLALALDSLIVPRLRYNSASMWEFAEALAVSGRKESAYGALPFPMAQGSSLPDTLGDCANTLLWKPLSACPEQGDELQSLVSQLRPGMQPPTPLHSLDCREDVLASYINAHYPATPCSVQLVSSPSKLTPPFPQIFSQSLGPQGFLQSQAHPPQLCPSLLLRVHTSLHSSPALGPWLLELQRGASALDPRRIAPSFLSRGTELADFQESRKQLGLLVRCYPVPLSTSSTEMD